MRPTTPSRSLGFSPTPLSPPSRGALAGLANTPPTTPRGGATILQSIPLAGGVSSSRPNRSIAGRPAVELSNAYGDATSSLAPVAPAGHTDNIIPFHLDLGERLLSSAASTSANQGNISAIHLTKDQLLQLQLETTDYIENLDLTLRTLFSHDNSKLRQTLVNSSEMPLTFMYLRLQQQMLKLSGDNSSKRERATLNKLAQLLEQPTKFQ